MVFGGQRDERGHDIVPEEGLGGRFGMKTAIKSSLRLSKIGEGVKTPAFSSRPGPIKAMTPA